MKTIWKYTLKNQMIQTIAMPKDAEILHVDDQHGEPCLWANVDPDAPAETREFAVLTTGQSYDPSEPPFRGGHYHLGTVLLQSGNFVVHVFEVGTDNRPQQQ